MRTRIRVNPEVTNSFDSREYYLNGQAGFVPRQQRVWAYWLPVPQYIWTIVPVTFTHTTPARECAYEVTTDKTTGSTRDMWNRFEHYKRSNDHNMSFTTLGTRLQIAEGGDKITCVPCADVYKESWFGPLVNPIAGLPVLLKMVNEEILNPPDHLEMLKARALKALLPGIRPQMSLVNSVIELKDFKTLPRTIKRLASIHPDIKNWKVPLRRALGAMADVFLQGEFNIMPLLSDVAGLQRALRDTSEQLKKLLALEKKRLVRHYNVGLSPEYYKNCTRETLQTSPITHVTLNGSPGQINGGFKPYRTVTYNKLQFHVEIEYSYYLSQFQRENAAILGLADSLGVNLNPQIIWNAIPWSFVVDWVLGVSQWLGQFKLQNMEPVTCIHRCLWSATIQRETQIAIECNLGDSHLPQSVIYSTRCIESAYKRELMSVGTTDISTSGVSLMEFALGSALGLSRVR